MSYPNYAARMESFGFEVLEVDGHNIAEVHQALLQEKVPDKPRFIVANTVKGKGISFMENNNSWHHNRLTLERYKQAMNELD
jgi:transketolase